MVFYHGTPNRECFDSIMKNGFTNSYGNYGIGVYGTSYKNLAKEYAENTENIIEFNISDEEIVTMTYAQLYFLIRKRKTKNWNFEIAEEFDVYEKMMIREKVKKNALLIKYGDYDEVVVYDKNIIRITKIKSRN